jgi:ATP-binding cassette subfamily F protein uup
VLDEPTNDLDLASLRALEDALLQFPGSLLVVSHDRWFLDRIATRIVHLDGAGGARVHEGDLSLLLDKLAAEAAAAADAEASARSRTAPRPAAPPKPRKLSTREQQELEALPAQIEQAEAELVRVDRELADPQLYTAAGRERFDGLAALRKELPVRIQELYARWQELESVAERARAGRQQTP